jgi:hypothetical protein
MGCGTSRRGADMPGSVISAFSEPHAFQVPLWERLTLLAFAAGDPSMLRHTAIKDRFADLRVGAGRWKSTGDLI